VTETLNGKYFVSVGELVELRNGCIVVVAAPGETCERVDPSSLPWLYEQGAIVPAPVTVPVMLTPCEVVLNADQQTRVAEAMPPNAAEPDEES
jgi:hypothetical protein